MSSPAHALTDKQEVEMGERYSEDVEDWLGPVLPANAPESQRVARIGRRFAHLSTRRVPFSYKVLDEPGLLNAFSLPGGPIYITKRLVNFTKNDAELAAVLGHETAHLQFRHAALRFDDLKRAQNFAHNLSVKILGKTSGEANQGFFMLGTYVAYAVWTRPYDRTQETDADVQGVRWMNLLGYDPHGAITLFQRFAKEREKITGRQDAATEAAEAYLSNHPSTSDRIARIKLLIEQEHLGQPAPKIVASATPQPVPVATESPAVPAGVKAGS